MEFTMWMEGKSIFAEIGRINFTPSSTASLLFVSNFRIKTAMVSKIVSFSVWISFFKLTSHPISFPFSTDKIDVEVQIKCGSGNAVSNTTVNVSSDKFPLTCSHKGLDVRPNQSHRYMCICQLSWIVNCQNIFNDEVFCFVLKPVFTIRQSESSLNFRKKRRKQNSETWLHLLSYSYCYIDLLNF